MAPRVISGGACPARFVDRHASRKGRRQEFADVASATLGENSHISCRGSHGEPIRIY